MSTAAPPTIPPRPTRAQQVAVAAGASKVPEIPPRPTPQKPQFTRSISPANYLQSPLFEMPSSTVGRPTSNDPSSMSLPPRPPSVSLPSIGQEGNEYADLEYEKSALKPTPSMEAAAQTRNVGGDLQLHAPKPSLPTASAKTQVEAVTKTTSKQAAALGIGKPSTPVPDDQEHGSTPLRAKSSFSRPASSASNERRASVQYGEEQGPAELGMRVPINPLLGDVQAPSPAPFGDRPSSMGGNNGAYGQRKRHTRTVSGREVFLPPGSYGLHGHGVAAQDKFEKDWYAKHPEQYLHDEDRGQYSSTGTGRGEFALSSEDLNHIVRSTASRGAGFGTSGLSVYPDEQIGYLASEQYASRSSVTSPNPLYKMHSNVSQPAIESPLRKTSFPADDIGHAEFNKSKDSVSGRSDDVVDSEQDDDVIHVDAPKHHYNKVTGGEETIHEKEDVEPYITHPTEENGLINEYGYSVPILASDEVAREVGGEDMQPAVPPNPERRDSAYDLDRGSGDVTPSSRPTSRPGSIHGGMHGLANSLSRFTSRHEDYRDDMHTPLEDVDEYEPLFPDEDSKKKAMSAAERFKRPETLKHRFPSQDIWEDTPSSAMHVATVSTPDIPSRAEQPTVASSSRTFESPEVEAARKGEATEEEKKKLIPNEERLAKSKFAPHLRDDMPTRPGLQPRFPSQDIWEDSPDSQHLVTTVSSRQDEEATGQPEPSTSKPSIPPRPNKSRLGEGASSAQIQPSVPPRPEKKVYVVPPADAKLSEITTKSITKSESRSSPTELRKVPSIPDRPKPQVPTRPAKNTSGDSLSKTVSSTSAGSSGSTETEKGVSVTSPPVVKAKPSIPPRPGQSSKIANLKGNFMNDLNQRLQLGPPKEKDPELEAEKEAKPLEDARKGRARGPQRRAPAKSPAGSGESKATITEKPLRFSLSSTMTMWHIDSTDGALMVNSSSQAFSAGSDDVPDESGHTAAASQTVYGSSIDGGALELSKDKVAQLEHSTPSGAPLGSVAEGTTDEGTAESKTAQVSTKQTADVAGSMGPAGLTTTTSGEPADPVDPGQNTDQATPHAELPNPLGQLEEHDFGDPSLSQQTTASSGGASGHVVSRVRAEDYEQGSSLSKHTIASSEASGATLDRQPTVERSNRKTAGGAIEEPKAILAASATEEEKLAGVDTAREPSVEEDVDHKMLEEMTAKAHGKDHSGVEPEPEPEAKSESMPGSFGD